MLRSFQIISLIVSLTCASSIPRPNGPPTVNAGKATYIGLNDSTYGVDSWLGIRYAQPPLKSLRLQAPKSYKANGVINSTGFGGICFQLNDVPNQSEDCLNLNVYTPSQACKSGKNHRARLPVMVWIHGGGFNEGAGSIYHPQALINRSVELKSPVIVVTINYRLSFLGFSGKQTALSIRFY